jgi:hypothetical protein
MAFLPSEEVSCRRQMLHNHKHMIRAEAEVGMLRLQLAFRSPSDPPVDLRGAGC